MMKIATITFHWAVNYGAVLQAYALQKFLSTKGFQNEIIDYKPLFVITKHTLIRLLRLDLIYFIKAFKIYKFKRKYIRVSKEKYYSNRALVKGCKEYDAYICGSDQIWNHSFTLKAEGKSTLSYFLNFVPSEKKRISYAASFGADLLNDEMTKIVRPELEKFHGISVREISGRKILNNLKFEASLVLDPTFLIDKDVYDDLLVDVKSKDRPSELFTYIIHRNQTIAKKVNEYLRNKYHLSGFQNQGNISIGIQEWIYNIKNSKFVLTNSYHGVIFAIIYQKPFIVVHVEGVSMNNRIKTILNTCNLSNRNINTYNEQQISLIFSEEIDWQLVRERIVAYKSKSVNFIDEMLSPNK